MDKLTKEQIDNLPEWIPVREFEGFYEVNCRAGIIRNARTLKVKKPSLGKRGYPCIGLCKYKRQYAKTIHRIVAMAAFGYYNISTDGLDVCHLDEERNDPRVANLALGSTKENMNFEKAKERISEAMKGNKGYWLGKHHSEETRKKLSEAMTGKHHSEETRLKIAEAQPKKRVGAYKDGKLIMVFQSTREAGRNGFNPSHISACCTGKLRTHRGYVWKYL